MMMKVAKTMSLIPDKTLNLFKEIARLWEPRPDLTVSEWADRYRMLTTATSAEPGPWRTDRAPYMREIMDSITDDNTEEVAIMASAQVGKTEFMLNMIGYHVDYDPCPIMFMLPDKTLINYFSKTRLTSMIEASEPLQKKFAAAKRLGNTINEKNFLGGSIAIVGANAASSLSSRPIRILLCDEVDRYPASAGTEGDPINLAKMRTTTFDFNRKLVYVSTPLNSGTSRIQQLYEDSTAEQWSFACPECGEYQPIKWAQIKFDYHKTDSGEFIVDKVDHACCKCGCLSDERTWKHSKGKWVAQKTHTNRRGFHLNQFSSPWVTWSTIVSDFLKAKRDGREKVKTWVNTVLGEPWEESGEKVDEEMLFERREMYDADVPEGVKILTAAVDVQDDRFEIEVVGWGIGRESWGIEYHVIHGDLKRPEIWHNLDLWLQKRWSKANGKQFGITCTCMDSGGHFTQEVYRFCKERESRHIYAIKGANAGKGEYVPLIARTTRPKPMKALLVTLGVNDGKARVMSSLQVMEPGPNYCHFPKGKGYELNYFLGLTAEKMEVRYEQGVPYQVWVKIRARNEAFDLRVYNTAAIEIVNPNFEKEYAGAIKKKRKRVRA